MLVDPHLKIVERPKLMRKFSPGMADNSEAYKEAGNSSTPLSSINDLQNASPPSAPIYLGKAVQPPLGRFQSNNLSYSETKLSSSTRFSIIMALFRENICFWFLRAMTAKQFLNQVCHKFLTGLLGKFLFCKYRQFTAFDH